MCCWLSELLWHHLLTNTQSGNVSLLTWLPPGEWAPSLGGSRSRINRRKGKFLWVYIWEKLLLRDIITKTKSESIQISLSTHLKYCLSFLHELWSFKRRNLGVFLAIYGTELFLIVGFSMCYLLSLQRRAMTARDLSRAQLWWSCHSLQSQWTVTGFCPVATSETHKKAESAVCLFSLCS